ncbi:MULTISPECIES: hypothetical protein [Pseudomonadota]|uniref:hypothetical protein n=1 Tax=Pseudomonadota TaxID=1224 RepID=UPI00200EF0F4|nr:hypothetical protein [Halomonas venusta]UQI42751.1 hypothetical protein M3L73_10995 [Halomonas venusta]
MGLYRNTTKGVINVGGAFCAPGKTAEFDDKAPGLARMLKRGVLVKSTASKPDPVPTKKDGGKTE